VNSGAAVIEISSTDERQSLEALFKTNYTRLARLVYRVIGDTGRAEEIASEVFWKYHRNRPPRDTNIEGWLYRTAVRSALDHVRAETRRSRYESLSPPSESPPNPEQMMQIAEERARVRGVLAALRPEYAEILLLRSEGCSYAEVAAALELNPASVGTLLSRAEAAFRKQYEEQYGKP
jgi:RNA polymerase sigma-70 factor, ECF subfamily